MGYMVKKIAKKKINKVVVLSVVVVVVTLFTAVVLIYLPFLNKTNSLRQDILKERERNILIGKTRALGKHLKVYKKQIPQGRGVSWLISVISDTASKEGIDISSIKPGAPEDRQLYTKLHVILDTISTYSELGKFISKIESSDKFLRVERVDIKRLDLDEDFDEVAEKFEPFNIKGNIIISTVVLKE